MLSDLFVRSLHRAEASPHSADLVAFGASLRASRYAAISVQRHVRRLHAALSGTTIPPSSSLTTDEVSSIFADRPGRGYYDTERLFRSYLVAQGRLIVPVTTVEPRFALKERHLQRLVELRGLAPNTILYLDWALTDFLSRVLEPDALPNYAGQGVGLIRDIQPAATIVAQLVAEAENTIRRLTTMLE